MNDQHTEKLLFKIIKAQNALLKGGKIQCSQNDISSLDVESILHATGDLFTSDELADLLGVSRSGMKKAYNRAVRRMKLWKKYYWFFVIGILVILFIILGSTISLSIITFDWLNSIFPEIFTI